MTRWTGETITLQVGAKWIYKLKLAEESGPSGRSEIILGQNSYSTEQEAKAAGKNHLKAEIDKRSI